MSHSRQQYFLRFSRPGLVLTPMTLLGVSHGVGSLGWGLSGATRHPGELKQGFRFRLLRALLFPPAALPASQHHKDQMS